MFLGKSPVSYCFCVINIGREPELRPEPRDFPVNFPVSRELRPRLVGSGLAAQPAIPPKPDGVRLPCFSVASSNACVVRTFAQTLVGGPIWSNSAQSLRLAFRRYEFGAFS